MNMVWEYKKWPSNMSPLAALALSSLMIDDALRGIDIKAEYALIQRKESKLSANMRRLVVKRYETR